MLLESRRRAMSAQEKRPDFDYNLRAKEQLSAFAVCVGAAISIPHVP